MIAMTGKSAVAYVLHQLARQRPGVAGKAFGQFVLDDGLLLGVGQRGKRGDVFGRRRSKGREFRLGGCHVKIITLRGRNSEGFHAAYSSFSF